MKPYCTVLPFILLLCKKTMQILLILIYECYILITLYVQHQCIKFVCLCLTYIDYNISQYIDKQVSAKIII